MLCDSHIGREDCAESKCEVSTCVFDACERRILAAELYAWSLSRSTQLAMFSRGLFGRYIALTVSKSQQCNINVRANLKTAKGIGNNTTAQTRPQCRSEAARSRKGCALLLFLGLRGCLASQMEHIACHMNQMRLLLLASLVAISLASNTM